jgi:quercetin dioxygenase-like cupin family protein
MQRRFFVRPADVPSYHPANHTGTTNRRLIGPETVGAKNVEVLLGVIEKGRGAEPHAHPGMEQVCYLLEGTALAEVDGQRCEMKPGDVCYFPAGEMHKFTATSEKAAKVLIIYSPPYGESPERVVRGK